MKKVVVVLLGVAGVAGCHRAAERPDSAREQSCNLQCQEQSAESSVRRAYRFRALAGDRFSFEQESRDIDAARREVCFDAALTIQELPQQVAAVKACREEWPVQADTTIEVK